MFQPEKSDLARLKLNLLLSHYEKCSCTVVVCYIADRLYSGRRFGGFLMRFLVMFFEKSDFSVKNVESAQYQIRNEVFLPSS